MAGPAMVATLVILRIASASCSNVLQKQLLRHHISPLALLVQIWGWMLLMSAPVWLWAIANSLRHPNLPATEPGSSASGSGSAWLHFMGSSTITDPVSFWLWMLLATILELPGNWLLLRSLQQTDLSIYGPLNSFKPVVGLFAAILLLGEFPSQLGFIGMCIVLCGTYGLADPTLGSESASWSKWFTQAGVRDRILAMTLTATASVFLKRAMESASEWAVLAVWSLLGWLLAVVFWSAIRIVQSRLKVATLDSHGSTSAVAPRFSSQRVFLIALCMLVMQGLTIALFRRMPVAYALALFQLGSLTSVYLGHRVFGEPNMWRRLTASTVMILGAILIIFAS